MLDSLWAKQTPNRAKELSNRVKEVGSGHWQSKSWWTWFKWLYSKLGRRI
jgi:hypothetical protein